MIGEFGENVMAGGKYSFLFFYLATLLIFLRIKQYIFQIFGFKNSHDPYISPRFFFWDILQRNMDFKWRN